MCLSQLEKVLEEKTTEKTLQGVPACPQALVPPEVESPSRSQMVKWMPRVTQNPNLYQVSS